MYMKSTGACTLEVKESGGIHKKPPGGVGQTARPGCSYGFDDAVHEKDS